MYAMLTFATLQLPVYSSITNSILNGYPLELRVLIAIYLGENYSYPKLSRYGIRDCRHGWQISTKTQACDGPIWNISHSTCRSTSLYFRHVIHPHTHAHTHIAHISLTCSIKHYCSPTQAHLLHICSTCMHVCMTCNTFKNIIIIIINHVIIFKQQ